MASRIVADGRPDLHMPGQWNGLDLCDAHMGAVFQRLVQGQRCRPDPDDNW